MNQNDNLPKSIIEYNENLLNAILEIEKYPNMGGDMFYGDAQEEIRKIMICENCGNKGIIEINTYFYPVLKDKKLCQICFDKENDKLALSDVSNCHIIGCTNQGTRFVLCGKCKSGHPTCEQHFITLVKDREKQ